MRGAGVAGRPKPAGRENYFFLSGFFSGDFSPGLAAGAFSPGLAAAPFSPGLAAAPFSPGLAAGLILGIIFVLAAQHLVPGGMSIDLGLLGAPGFFIGIFLFLVIFILGTFAGDWLERVFRK